MSSNFIQRTLAGAVLVAVIIGAVMWSQYSSLVLFALISSVAIWEFHRMTNVNGVSVSFIEAIIGNLLLHGALFLNFTSSFAYTSPVFAPYIGFLILIFILELFRKKENPIADIAMFLFGQFYIALPFGLLYFILFFGGEFQPFLLLLLFITMWVNDSFAYLSGVTLGKHKFFERISPKKTWEGFIGGILAVVALAYVISIYRIDLSFIGWVSFTLIIAIFGTLGDLFESLLKRTYGTKDSSHIIPGHGGILDRFDSLIFATPVLVLFLYIYNTLL